jgi:hypothetical protein
MAAASSTRRYRSFLRGALASAGLRWHCRRPGLLVGHGEQVISLPAPWSSAKAVDWKTELRIFLRINP